MPTFSNTPIPTQPKPAEKTAAVPEVTANAGVEVTENTDTEVTENTGVEVTASASVEVTENTGAEVTANANTEVTTKADTQETANAVAPVTAAAPAAEAAPSKASPKKDSAFRVPPSDSVNVGHFRTAPPAAMAKLNADLGLSLDAYRFNRLQLFFRTVAKREPTVGELRLLDGLDQLDRDSSTRIAVGELITQSEAVAATWADMMASYGELGGVGDALRGTSALAAPPCSLADALSLAGRSLYQKGLRLPTHGGDPRNGSRTVLLSSPDQEAAATAEGYRPVARLSFGQDTRSLWVRPTAHRVTAPAKTGDYLLYLPALKPRQASALYDRLAECPHPLGILRAVAGQSLLLSMLTVCPSLDLYADRLTAHHKLPQNGRVPVSLLCAPAGVAEDGTADHLLRVPLKQLRDASELLKNLDIPTVICGQALTGERTVIRVKNATGREDIPVVELPTEFLRATAAVYLHRYTVPRQTLRPDQPSCPPMTRLPSPHTGEWGITPDGRELTALTLHEGRVLTIPEAETVLSVATAHVPEAGMGYTAAAEAAAQATDTLAVLGVPPEAMVLSVSLTLGSREMLTDSRIPEVLCGLYRLATDRMIPVDDPAITVQESRDADLRVTILAWARDGKICAQPALGTDRQWKVSGLPVHKESPAYLLPVIRRSYEDSLRALTAALNRNAGAACVLHPILVSCEGEESRPALLPESVKTLCEELFAWKLPIFAMSEADTRMLLDDPGVLEALNRLTEWGYPILVLGDSCAPFAEKGFLPACLTRLTSHAGEGQTATVTYRAAADSVTRLLRCPLLAPLNPEGTAPLLTLHLPDGTRVPDGFTGRDNKVLGLLNGLDVTLLPLLRGHNRFDL